VCSSRILVADDDPSFRKIAVRLLEREGYEVEEASDATEALAMLSARAFELVVADVNMPGNWPAARPGEQPRKERLAVLHHQGGVPVLVVTGDPTVETAVAALRGTAVDYLSKPLSPQRFLARVADGVARGRALRTLQAAEARLQSQLELVASLRQSSTFAGPSTPTIAPPRTSSLDSTALPRSVAALLSPREREVLRVFRASPRTAAVASLLNISPHTVKNHLKAIFRKLDVSSQAELLARLGQAERDDG
jgi:DNA-binding NarL/FixJ family response regulator